MIKNKLVNKNIVKETLSNVTKKEIVEGYFKEKEKKEKKYNEQKRKKPGINKKEIKKEGK